MDGEKFDSIARAFASGSTRRTLLKSAGLLGIGISAIHEEDASAAPRENASAPPKLVRICIPGRNRTYVEKMVSAYLVPLYKLLGGFEPAAGVSCSQTCVPQAKAVTCGPTAAIPRSRCVPQTNNCGTVVDCGPCGAGEYCDAGGYCQEGCGSDRDCTALSDSCNATSCDNHVCVQTHINESYKCAESDSACSVWYCTQGVCGKHVHVTAQTPCGECMKCTYEGECIQVPTGHDPFDHCRGLQYCQEGACTGCADDDACGEGEYCRDGDCVGGCSEDAQCTVFADDCNDSVCYENKCIPVPARDRETCAGEMENGYLFDGHCQGGVCRQCLDDAHCAANYYCSPYLWCEFGGCVSNDDCSDQADACNTGVCSGGSCSKQASNEGMDCPGGVCVNGTCTDNSLSTPAT